jgi:hypothetical protein
MDGDARPRVKPAQKKIPEEFHPSRKLTAKQYTFGSSGSRSDSSIPSSLLSDPPPAEPSAEPSAEEEASESASRSLNETALADPDGNALREQTLDSHDFSGLADDDLDLLIAHLKEYVKCSAADGRYEEARQCKSLYNDAMQTRYHRIHDRIRSDSPRTRLQAVRREQQELWDRELEEHDQDTQDKIEQLRRKHDLELKKFELHWQTEDTLRKYRKPSSRLLQMWRMEKYLARTEKFTDAEILKLETEELARRERALGQAAANRDFHTEHERLLNRQRKEYDLLVATQQHWREVLVSRQKKERAVIENKDLAVEAKQKEPCRQRDAQLTAVARNSRKKRFSASSEISFRYTTVLPPPVSPADLLLAESMGVSTDVSGRESAGSERSQTAE